MTVKPKDRSKLGLRGAWPNAGMALSHAHHAGLELGLEDFAFLFFFESARSLNSTTYRTFVQKYSAGNGYLRRVANPWPRSEVFGDANLRLEYLMNEDIAGASTVIPNSANPGVGDLTISGGATFIASRQEWRLP